MKSHEYADIFPMLSDADLASLAADIKEHGLRNPIITLHGEILDGRNRDRACEIAGVQPIYEAYQGDDPLGFVISQNLHRRHLTESQRGMAGAKMAQLKDGPPAGSKNASKLTSPIGEVNLEPSPQSRLAAAEALNVGTGTIDRARAVQRTGVPELVKAVESGEVKLGAAHVIAKLPAAEQAELVSAGPEAVKQKAADIRNKREPKEAPIQTADARKFWVMARCQLDRILSNDKEREEVLREVIAYAQKRIDTKK